jgi:hypothetical protein
VAIILVFCETRTVLFLSICIHLWGLQKQITIFDRLKDSYQSDSFITPLIKIFPKKENAEQKKKKMWKGVFLCCGTVLELKNYQTN